MQFNFFHSHGGNNDVWEDHKLVLVRQLEVMKKQTQLHLNYCVFTEMGAQLKWLQPLTSFNNTLFKMH